MKFFNRKKKDVGPFNDEKNIRPFAVSSENADTDFTLWSNLYFRNSEGINTTNLQACNVPLDSITFDSIYNTYDSNLSSVELPDEPKPNEITATGFFDRNIYLKEYIRLITIKIFKLWGFEFKAYDFDTMIEKDHRIRPIFISALFRICITYRLDFIEIFKAIKDISLCEGSVTNVLELDESWECCFSWSFGDFTSLPSHNEFKISGDEKYFEKKWVQKIKKLFIHCMDEFLGNARVEDIEALHNFIIKYSDYMDTDIVDMIYDIVDMIYDTEEIAEGLYISNPDINSIEIVNAIVRCCPSYTVQAYTSYVYHILDCAHEVASMNNTEWSAERLEVLKKEFMEVIKIIANLHEYRSEEFYDLENDYASIIKRCMDDFDGEVLNLVQDVFQTIFKIDEEDVESVIHNYVGKLLNVGDNDLIASYVSHLTQLLSNKLVFDLVNEYKPQIIDLFT